MGRVELEHDGEMIEVELTRERHQALNLESGQTAWLRPRQVKLFAASQLPATAPKKQGFLF